MRRYKIVACILLILPVFGFVLAAPVAVKKVREACADAVDGGENVIIGSRKRTVLDDEKEPLLKWWAKSQQGASQYWSSTPWRQQVSSPAPKYASGTQQKPSFSSKPPLLSTSGGTELPKNPEGQAKLIQPGTSTEIVPASSSKAKSVLFSPSKKVLLPSGQIYTEMLPPDSKPPLLSITGGTELPKNPEGQAKLIQPGTSTEIVPASSSKAKSVLFASSKKVLPPSGQIHTEMLPPDPHLPLPPGGEGHQSKFPAWQSLSSLLSTPPSPPPPPPSPKPKSKSIFRKLLRKLKFKIWRRNSGTPGGVVTEG